MFERVEAARHLEDVLNGLLAYNKGIDAAVERWGKMGSAAVDVQAFPVSHPVSLNPGPPTSYVRLAAFATVRTMRFGWRRVAALNIIITQAGLDQPYDVDEYESHESKSGINWIGWGRKKWRRLLCTW